MLGDAWLFITSLLVVSALILKQPPLLVLAALFFLASGVARVWSRYSLRAVNYGRAVSTKRAFFGESLTLDLTVGNRKLLPLPWLHVEEEIPTEVSLLKGHVSPSHKPERAVLSSFLSLGWYDRLTRRYPVRCSRRGDFLFGPATISSGDPFGFFRKTVTVEHQDRLLVYPPILPLEKLGIPSRAPFGDLRTRRHLFEDPVQVATTRDYAAGDPLKHIHWKAAARLGRLQTRVFEKTTSPDIALFLDGRTVAVPLYWGSVVRDSLETAVIAVASIAADAAGKGYRVGFYANEYYRASDRLIKLPPSEHPDQLRAILEALAQIRGLVCVAAEKLLAMEARNIPWEATIVVVASVPTDALITCLSRLRRVGRKVALVLIGSRASVAGLDGISLYRVSEEVYREQLASLRIEPAHRQTGTGS